MDMKHEEFIRRLSELAEVKNIKKTKKPIRSRFDEEPIDIQRPDLNVTLTANDNPTLQVEIIRVKKQFHHCDGCDEMVQGRVVERKLYDFPKLHWRDNCKSCLKSYNPETDCFDIDTRTAHYHIGDILKTTKFMVKKIKVGK
jgi:hypothetical protein